VPVYLDWESVAHHQWHRDGGQPSDWNVTLVGRIRNGVPPYTPQITEQNRLPANQPADANRRRCVWICWPTRPFHVAGVRLTAYLKVYNLLTP